MPRLVHVVCTLDANPYMAEAAIRFPTCRLWRKVHSPQYASQPSQACDYMWSVAHALVACSWPRKYPRLFVRNVREIVVCAGRFRSQPARDRQVKEFTHGNPYNLPPAVDDDLDEPPVQQSAVDMTQTLITADGRLTRLAVPADQEDAEEVRYLREWQHAVICICLPGVRCSHPCIDVDTVWSLAHYSRETCR